MAEDWRPIDTAPAAAKVEAMTVRGKIITGSTTRAGKRGRRGWNTIQGEDGYFHVCTHWRYPQLAHHPVRALPPGGLTSQERFLLEWLSKEDFSALGECEGQALTVLVNCGLAEVTDKHLGGWAKVALTDAGRAQLAAS